MDLWIWSILLLGIGLGIVVVEFFIPSGGVLAVFAGLSLLGAIILAFMTSLKFGVGMLSAVAILLPGILSAAIYVWPHTRFGQRMLVQPPTSDEEILPDFELRRHLLSLVGKRGVARSMMLPSGIVMIDGRSYDAISDGMPVEQGQGIEVVAVKMNRLEVRPVEGEPIVLRPAPPLVDPLSRPASSLGLESLDEPLN
jgi:membrane-bound ClpP family serine protease